MDKYISEDTYDKNILKPSETKMSKEASNLNHDRSTSAQKSGQADRHARVGVTALVITEVLRWVIIVIPVYLSVWQYIKYRGFTIFISDADEEVQFWCIVSAIIVVVSLGVYLPLKVHFIRLRLRTNWIRDHRWRPSIVVYILICAMPCLTLVLVAVKFPVIEQVGEGTASPDICFEGHALHPETATVLQVVVFGLSITEWMSKLREEVITFDLISAMAIDFFFAYDVIAFIMMPAYEPEVYNSEWVYVCFAFAWVAMFKYVPTQPVSISERGAPKGASTAIIVTMLCNDLPFVIIRFYTLFTFGYLVCDFINPVKNIGMIAFGAIQLFIIWRNTQEGKKHFSEKRIAKFPGAWGCEAGMAMVIPAVTLPVRAAGKDARNEPEESQNQGENFDEVEVVEIE